MTKLYDFLMELVNRGGVSALNFLYFLAHATEMVRHAGKSCVAMTRADAENAMRNFEYGRYEKFDLKAALKTLPYRTFLIESEAFPNPNPRFLKTLTKARSEIDGSIRNAFLVRILDATMEVDVLHVDKDGLTVKCLSYVFPFFGRKSIDRMAYDAVGWMSTVFGSRKIPNKRSLHEAIASDLSVLIPCLVRLAKKNGSPSNGVSKKSPKRKTKRLKGVPGDPNVVLESDLLPKRKANAAPKKSRGKGGHPGLGVPKKPHMVRGHYRTYKRGTPDEYKVWIKPHPVHPELMTTSNPIRKRA